MSANLHLMRGSVVLGPPIQYIGSVSNVAGGFGVPSDAMIGDIIIGSEFRTADNSAITFPGGDIKQPTVGGNIVRVNIAGTTQYGLFAYEVSDENGTETWTGFTNATSTILDIFRNVDPVNPILALTLAFGTGNPIVIPALGHNDANATVVIAGRTANAVNVPTPSGFSSRAASARNFLFDKQSAQTYAGEDLTADSGPLGWVVSVCALKRA
jgi:hypothetical protein